MSETKEVFCKGCEYCEVSDTYVICCLNSIDSNITMVKTFYRSYVDIENPRVYCGDRNRNNDCPYYKKKPWWMFWSG